MDERTELIQRLSAMTETQWKWFLAKAADLFTGSAVEEAVERGTVGEVSALYQATNALERGAELSGLPQTATAYREARTAILLAVGRMETAQG